MKTYDVTNAGDAFAVFTLKCGEQIKIGKHGFALKGHDGSFGVVPSVGETRWTDSAQDAVNLLRRLANPISA